MPPIYLNRGCCPCGGVSVPCCPNLVPRVVYGTFGADPATGNKPTWVQTGVPYRFVHVPGTYGTAGPGRSWVWDGAGYPGCGPPISAEVGSVYDTYDVNGSGICTVSVGAEIMSMSLACRGTGPFVWRFIGYHVQPFFGGGGGLSTNILPVLCAPPPGTGDTSAENAGIALAGDSCSPLQLSQTVTDCCATNVLTVPATFSGCGAVLFTG